LTYANVIATLALFLALGGGAYAAFKLPKNSVGSKQIKANAVNSSKVKDGSLLAGDFKAGQLPAGAQGVRGPKGDKGDPCLPSDPNCKGPKGDTGPQGPGAISIPITHVGETFATLRTIHGIDVGYSCSTSSQITLKLTPVGGYTTVYVSGEKAENGALSPLNTNGGIITASGSTSTTTSTASLDVIATSDGTWNRIDLGGFGGGGSNGCNVWGLIIPGT
jgi:hypothetical protein